jgi:hypothetical protein
VNDWKLELLPHLAAHLLTDSLNSPINANENLRIEENLLKEMHSALIRLFVDLPSKAFHSGLCNRHRVYKTPEAGHAQHVLAWLHRYKIALRTLLNMKLKGAKNLHKNDRKTIRRTYMDFQNDKNLQSALPGLDTGLLSRNFLLWSNEEYLTHLNLINTLRGQWKKELDNLLSKAKQLHKEHCKEKVFQTPIGSKARQSH